MSSLTNHPKKRKVLIGAALFYVLGQAMVFAPAAIRDRLVPAGWADGSETWLASALLYFGWSKFDDHNLNLENFDPPTGDQNLCGTPCVMAGCYSLAHQARRCSFLGYGGNGGPRDVLCTTQAFVHQYRINSISQTKFVSGMMSDFATKVVTCASGLCDNPDCNVYCQTQWPSWPVGFPDYEPQQGQACTEIFTP